VWSCQATHIATEEVLVSHAIAIVTPAGRLRLARCVVEDRWSLRRAAQRFGVSVTTAQRWAIRYRQMGAAGMVDRSSRPAWCPHRLPTRTERRILGLRVSRRWGPARIAYRLGLNPSTVHKVLVRYGAPPLAWTDPATGTRVKTSRPKARRYEHTRPGDLVHVDVKKLGRIPDGGGHKVLGRAAARTVKGASRPGYAYLHHALDDHSRLVYSEILTDERKETAAAFWSRASAWFTGHGITVRRVLTDNGSCYRSTVFAQALGEDVTHKRTRPYRPQTNGKVERFNRTLLEEWAYARPYASETERAAAYDTFLHTYNHHRGHTALAGASPADRVPNLAGQYS
jgi:transposase InsO family protein